MSRRHKKRQPVRKLRKIETWDDIYRYLILPYKDTQPRHMQVKRISETKVMLSVYKVDDFEQPTKNLGMIWQGELSVMPEQS